jgi:hypothetical protein
VLVDPASIVRIHGYEPFAASMNATAIDSQRAIDYAVASRARPGESVSGDISLVTPCDDGVLISVIDGLGHGEEAIAVARLAVTELERHVNEPVLMMVQHCHRALQRTRGVVMTIVALNTRGNTLTAIGIGNVETAIVRANPHARPARESVLLRNGVVGYRLPELHASVLPLGVGDLLVFATDGVRDDFADLIAPTDSPAPLAEKILAQKFRGTDDALVLACKYLGKP